MLRNIHDIFEERSGTDWWKHTRPTFKQILPELAKKLVTWSHHVTTPWEGAGKGAGKRDVHERRFEEWIVSALTVHEIARRDKVPRHGRNRSDGAILCDGRPRRDPIGAQPLAPVYLLGRATNCWKRATE